MGKRKQTWADAEARMAAWVYVCSGCGAVCRQVMWAALGVERPEEICPGCGRWRRFTAKDVSEERQAAA